MNYLQLNNKGKFSKEEQLLADYFGEGNYTPFYAKHFLQNKIKITKDDFIAGTIQVMFPAFKRLGIDYRHEDYPEDLKPFLYRKIWKSTIGLIENRIYNDDFSKGVFIKPLNKLKKFTGFVLNYPDQLYLADGAGKNTEIMCSEPVKFLVEYRCPVINGIVQGTYYYDGDEDIVISKQKVQEIANAWKSAPAGYALDVGVLDSGELALIEINDAFSLGAYEMDKDTYGKLITTRWKELINEI